jgi:hypothetical protein
MILGMVVASCSQSNPTMQSKTPSTEAAANGPAAKAPDEAAATEALRKTAEAQTTYFKINRRYALTFDELVDAHLLNSEPTATQTGYDFKLRPAADAQTYKLSVVPAGAATASVRHFFMDQSGTIHADTGKDATAESPVVQ